MTFTTFELNVHLAPAFVAAVDEAMQSERAELVLLYATSARHGLFILCDYLQVRARETPVPEGRSVRLIQYGTTDEQLDAAVTAYRPGDLVFFSELDSREQPGTWQHAVSAAGRFVEKGATVFAVLQGGDEATAKARLEQLWAVSLSQGLVARGTPLPAYRLIQLKAGVQELPV